MQAGESANGGPWWRIFARESKLQGDYERAASSDSCQGVGFSEATAKILFPSASMERKKESLWFEKMD